VTSYNGRLDQTGILDPTDPSKVIGTTGYAILPVTVEGLTGDKVSSTSRSEDAMIDTGATTTAVHPSLARDLDLEQVGRELGGDAEEDHPTYVPLYRVRITISAIEGEWDLLALGRDYPYPHLFRVIIGNDILKSCRFTFDGPAESFALELPHAR